mmetsp:Transcript_8286/g.13910  ORF Transcript_8286/g.13910 Transcript_8286/m.13910 type:complete len:82 (+) Transcript_8286:292-537(+)
MCCNCRQLVASSPRPPMAEILACHLRKVRRLQHFHGPVARETTKLVCKTAFPANDIPSLPLHLSDFGRERIFLFPRSLSTG